MLHRLEWEKVNGPIPDGHNINHKCKNRECANVNHLEVLTLSEHAALDNSTRYRDKEQELVAYIMLNPDLSQEQIAQDMGVSQSTVCKTAQRKLNNG
jgi:DNA-directed RNA polymerase specialized sigma subunit